MTATTTPDPATGTEATNGADDALDVTTDQPRIPAWRAALAGLLGAGVALGVVELIAGIVRDARSLVITVGDAIIELTPGDAVRTGIEWFGTADKPILVAGVTITSLLVGARVGMAARRRPWTVPVVFGLFAVIGIWAASGEPLSHTGWAAISSVIGAGAGVLVVRHLLAHAAVAATDAATEGAGSRREFLAHAGVVGAAAVAAPVIGRRLDDRFSVDGLREDVQLNTGGEASSSVAVDTSGGSSVIADGPITAEGLPVDGISRLYTPNDDFYRIDTALEVPQIDPSGYSVRIGGMVDNPFEITFDELVDMAVYEYDVTICCVSNRVGGDLIGNARWTGVPLRDVLDAAGVQPAGTQIVSESVDGWTSGFPTELAYDGRPAIIAVGMNGEPLPVAHGFPARLVVAGIYGYVSATKWLKEIRLTGWDDENGYWIPRGWAKEGPIKTQSRIDVPDHNAQVPAGRVDLGGVAWAQTRGIETVQVSIDDGPWQDADLGDELTVNTWRQWAFRWDDATPGIHTAKVRAIDSAGDVQTANTKDVAPDGAEGHHTIRIRVEDTAA